MRALEASAITGLRKGLRRGSVWISHSLSFRARDQMLIPPAQGARARSAPVIARFAPQGWLFLARLSSHLKAGLAALEEAREAGRVTVGTDGALHLSALEALPTDGIPRRTRDLMFKEIGTTQLADLLIEMDVHTGFSETLLARRARDANELVSLYVALIAHGTDLDAKSVVAMVPQLDLAPIATAMRALEMPGRLRARTSAWSSSSARIRLPNCGARAARIQRFHEPGYFAAPLYARVDPRRRTHAVGIYTHVLDQHGIVYNQPIVLNERQAGVAIEGVLRHNESRDDGGLLRLSVDTHGYTSVGMAVSKLLGFDLCPGLRNLAERKLYLPRGFAVSEGLAPAVALRRFAQGNSRRLGRTAAARRLDSVRPRQRGGRAAAVRQCRTRRPGASGRRSTRKLLRTLFLCDYFSNVAFRRELHTLLNRGESVHQLQRAIYTGRVAPSAVDVAMKWSRSRH